MSDEPLDCRSKAGQTLGLVDAVNHVARAVMEDNRDRTHPEVQKALADCYQEPLFQAFLAAAQSASDAYMAAEQASNG